MFVVVVVVCFRAAFVAASSGDVWRGRTDETRRISTVNDKPEP